MKESETPQTALYLTFKLGKEVFAFDVYRVREVLDLSPITKVPQAADFMRGVINVRGSMVPVVDMRMKFGMPAVDNTVNTRVVVMEVSVEGEETVLGAIADSVHEVIELEPEQIEAPPTLGGRWRNGFIRGIGKRGEQFVIILNLSEFFSSVELGPAQETDVAPNPEKTKPMGLHPCNRVRFEEPQPRQ